MQMPREETITTPPDDTHTGPVPPMGPGTVSPDKEDSPLHQDDPGKSPAVPPKQSPFPDRIQPPGNTESL